jgi:hypothetical protein
MDMIRVVHKFYLNDQPVGRKEPNEVTVPVGSTFLKAEVQRDQLVAWFLVDPKETREVVRAFIGVGSGHKVDATGTKYRGTFILLDGHFVLHLFENNPPYEDAA